MYAQTVISTYNVYVDFFDRVKDGARNSGTTIEYLVNKAGLKLGSYNTLRREGRMPRADEVLLIARELGTTVEYLITGEGSMIKKTDSTGTLQVIDTRGIEVSIDGEVSFIPLLDQKVAADEWKKRRRPQWTPS